MGLPSLGYSTVVLFLALSCLQGRPMEAAFRALARLGPDGIQLTPGNLPTPGFEAFAQASGVALRTHHGFDFRARKRPVWRGGQCLVDADSVHPESADGGADLDGTDLDGTDLDQWLDAQARIPVLETMYPGYFLGHGAELDRAMKRGLWLAVDVSHVFIQLERGALDRAAWRRLAEYPHIAEIHVSHNAGRHDTHSPITADTFGLSWARERASDGIPLILESYFHNLSDVERKRQLDRVRGEREWSCITAP